MDRVGAPHPGEVRPLHGEAGVASWALQAVELSGQLLRASFAAQLPLAGLQLLRTVTLQGSTATLATTVTGSAGQAVEWCEHTTLGNAFLDGCSISAGIDACFVMPEAGCEPQPFPELAAALAVPEPGAAPEGHVRSCRVAGQQGSWAAENAALGWRLSAAWSAEAFPWLCLWTEHKLRTHEPWAGRERTRGMEISTKPFPEGKPPAVRESSFQGRASACQLGAGGSLTKSVSFSWERL